MTDENETPDGTEEPAQTAANDMADAGNRGGIGYGRPPRHSRFQPGRSGNPKGRPKGSRSLRTVLAAAIQEKVTVRTANGTRKVTKLDALIQKTLNRALNDDAASTRLLVSMLERTGMATEGSDPFEAARASQISAEDELILARYLGQPASGLDTVPDPEATDPEATDP